MTTKWMTPAQAFRSQPAAAHHTEARDGFRHVIGAAGRVAAAAGKQRRQRHLVGPNQGAREFYGGAHSGPALSELAFREPKRERVEGWWCDRSETNSSSTRSNGASSNSRRGTTTMSSGAEGL